MIEGKLSSKAQKVFLQKHSCFLVIENDYTKEHQVSNEKNNILRAFILGKKFVQEEISAPEKIEEFICANVAPIGTFNFCKYTLQVD